MLHIMRQPGSVRRVLLGTGPHDNNGKTRGSLALMLMKSFIPLRSVKVSPERVAGYLFKVVLNLLRHFGRWF